MQEEIRMSEIKKLIPKRIWEWARRINVEDDDLISVAALAALEALKNYNPQKGTKKARLKFYVTKRLSLFLKKEQAWHDNVELTGLDLP